MNLRYCWTIAATTAGLPEIWPGCRWGVISPAGRRRGGAGGATAPRSAAIGATIRSHRRRAGWAGGPRELSPGGGASVTAGAWGRADSDCARGHADDRLWFGRYENIHVEVAEKAARDLACRRAANLLAMRKASLHARPMNVGVSALLDGAGARCSRAARPSGPWQHRLGARASARRPDPRGRERPLRRPGDAARDLARPISCCSASVTTIATTSACRRC